MKKVSTEELKSMRNRGVQFVLINVLPAKNFEETRIPGARSIPLEDANFLSRVEQAAGDKAHTVVVYCAGEQCPASRQAAEKLDRAGFTDVLAYEGGAQDWHDAEKMAGAHA